MGAALALVAVNWLIVMLERGGYRDNVDETVSAIDALYYTTVTLSTTGYGDITPVTESARLVNALAVTPMRLLFVIILVGTTISALTQRSREEFRLARWRSRVKSHVLVLGFGTKGRNAVRALLLQGYPASRIVVVDADIRAVEAAVDQGLVAVAGPATNEATLREALIERASTVIVALGRDDSAILATLTARRANPKARVVAAARQSENAELLEQSGATSVIVTSETTGRLLGLAADSPAAVAVVEDLVAFGTGLDLVDREIAPDEVGKRLHEVSTPVLAVVRRGRVLHYNDPDAGPLQAGDRVVCACA
ncbi:potassium channel family protein [Motilibacter sp. E257]|uniref:Potassium channel family protein n=2 Tax=Motilibacter deserti TaxID=2714956 RepID=A0ABX0GYN5_9ACTN|nr:potassium channel family protein [Motilibacter deserti]NHC14705.1 potassium channel family protein [Motilibacter deserti]